MKNRPSWISDEDYEFVYSRTPRICVDLMPVTQRGVILSRRDIEPFKGLWHFPGGRIKYRESVEDAVRRVGRDELGVNVCDLELVDYLEVLRDGAFVHSNSFVFAARITPEEIIRDHQASEIDYFTYVPQIMHPFHIDVLTKHLPSLLSKYKITA